MRRGNAGRCREAGFTYFGVIIAVMLIGMTLAVAGTVTRTAVQREREVQLLWTGHAYQKAILRFYTSNGGRLPHSLPELVTDSQAIVPQHFLRRLYPDPITGMADWELMTTPDGGIYGVFSRSTQVPLKVRGFSEADQLFEDAACYRAWKFVFSPQRRIGVATSLSPTTTASDC